MRRFKMLSLVGAASLALMPAALPAASASQEMDYRETEVVNHHTSAIVSYRVELADGDTWSENLVRRPVRANATSRLGTIARNARFECRLATTITFADGTELSDTIDYCFTKYVNVSGEAIWAERETN